MLNILISICISKFRGVGTFYSIGASSFVGTFKAKVSLEPKVPSFS
jgi:hypothetical protein